MAVTWIVFVKLSDIILTLVAVVFPVILSKRISFEEEDAGSVKETLRGNVVITEIVGDALAYVVGVENNS